MEHAEQHRQFEEWIERHGAIIFRVVHGFAERDERDDLLQEILLSIWKAIPSYRGEAKSITFVYRICHNAALLWRRSQFNYRRRLERFQWLREPDEASFGGTDHQEEQLKSLYAAIRQLSPPDRSLILLSLDGLSYREMAELHGISESNVGAKLHRIKRQLTQILRNHDHE